MERIHEANLLNFGILPLKFKDETDYDNIDQGDELHIDDIITSIEQGKPIIVKNKTKNIEYNTIYNLSDRQKMLLLAGGTLAYMKNK